MTSVVNPTDKAQEVELNLKGVKLNGEGMSWVITGPGRMAHNDPGRPREVDIRREPYRNSNGVLRVPAYSVAVFELGAQ